MIPKGTAKSATSLTCPTFPPRATHLLLPNQIATKIPMIMNFISYWVVGFSISYILGVVLDYGTKGVWLGLTVALLFAGTCQMLRLLYLTNKFNRLH